MQQAGRQFRSMIRVARMIINFLIAKCLSGKWFFSVMVQLSTFDRPVAGQRSSFSQLFFRILYIHESNTDRERQQKETFAVISNSH